MNPLFDFFSGETARLMASVVAFAAFFLIGRIMQARQKVAFAFAFTPLFLFAAVQTAAATGLI
jgi:hypothetical protein